MLAMPLQAAMSSQELAFLFKLVAPLLRLRPGKNNVSRKAIIRTIRTNTTYKYKES